MSPSPSHAPPVPEPPLAAKLKFLKSACAYPGKTTVPECRETHMSWVFLVGDRVFKLKKPVRFPFLDFSTLASREFNCREELRLNARLAPSVYLGLVALQVTATGFALVPLEQLPGPGTTVDWLVQMQRLPAEASLQARISQTRVEPQDVDALIEVLARFYRNLPPVDLTASAYLARFQREQAANREVLLRPQFQLRDAALALDRLDAALAAHAGPLAERVESGRIVDGHGDLRPEHVWLLDLPVVIDALEFNAALRQVDPFDELAYLGLECEVAGAAWIAPRLLAGCAAALADAPPQALIRVYTAYRAVLRARLAMAHLLDPQPRTPHLWPARAEQYLQRALIALPDGETGIRPNEGFIGSSSRQ